MKKLLFLSIIVIISISIWFLFIKQNNNASQTGSKIGNKDSEIKVILYGDLRCPHCKEFHNDIFPKIKKDYIDNGKVSFEYKDLGILGYESYKLGKLSYVINKHAPNKYWNYVDSALNVNANPNKLIENLDVSKNIKNKIKKDYREQDNYATKKMENNTKEAKSKSINVVPSITINGKKIKDAKNYKIIKNNIKKQ